VDENKLAAIFKSGSLPDAVKTPECSRVISSHIGMKQKHCCMSLSVWKIFNIESDATLSYSQAFTHFSNGGKPIRSKIKHHKCPATRTILIPVDTSIRMAIIIPRHADPHNHPMPPMIKASYDTGALYGQCVDAFGAMGATVKKIDSGLSSLSFEFPFWSQT
jgi:hypothetical protein